MRPDPPRRPVRTSPRAGPPAPGASRRAGRAGERQREREAPAPRHRRGWPGRVQAWLLRHAQTLVGTLGRLSRTPVESLMTIAVVGVALALPIALAVLVQNATAMTSGWNFRAELSLYLKTGLAPGAAEALRARLTDDARIAAVELIPAEAGLQTFREQTGLDAALAALGENPLPDVLVVVPAPAASDPASITALAQSLRPLPEVDLVREDLEWIRRLDALLEVLRRVMVVTAVLLVAAMLLVVGNAVRLEIAGRRDEIIVSKLIGATDAFIRRPFVYRGLWIGLAGGAVALTLVALLLAGLGGATRQLSQLYGADFALQGPSLAAVGGILLGAGLLGAASAWLAATWHLRRVEPN